MNALSVSNGLDIEELDLSGSSALTVCGAPPAVSPAFGFDYTGVSSAIAREAEEVAERIRSRLRVSIIDTGKDLLSVKDKLDHGKFGRWLRFHFSMTERTAENYMNAARAFESAPLVIDVLPANTVYKLAAKDIPAATRQSIIDEIAGGAIPHHKDVEARVAVAKKDERRKRENDREKQAEARAWNRHVKGLKAAGKTDEEVGAEQKRWESKKGRKTREIERKQVEVEKLERQRQRQKEEYEELQLKRQETAARVAAVLKKNMGDDFEKFREIICKIIYPEFRQAFAAA